MKRSNRLVLISLLMISIFLPTIAMSQGIVVEITPLSGLPDTALKITGKGFQPQEEIDILFILGEGMIIGLGTQKVDVITADSAGTFVANSAIPLMAKPGQYTIKVIGNKGSQAMATLEVTAKK